MALGKWVAGLSMIAAASPAFATTLALTQTAATPAGTAATRYCLHVEPATGSRLETVQCWTREEWADQDVDVDKEWAKEGVKVIG